MAPGSRPGHQRTGAPGGTPASPLALLPAARRRRWPIGAVAVALVVSVAVVLGASRVGARVPDASLVADGQIGAESTAAPVLPWPAAGEAAVAVPSLGVLQTNGAQQPVPVASLTKIMTAYLVLRDHPLADGAQGPTVTMGAVDVADDASDEAQNASNVPVTAGEVLTERQLLDGMLVRSANDFADALARWDAGSVAAFVAQMNATAERLGLSATHFADPSGLADGSQSSAGDLARLSALAMAQPAFAAAVDEPTVTLPGAGTEANYVTAVGHGGVIGVKSGFTQAAMGCLVLAAEPVVDGRPVLALAVVTGQPGWDPLTVAQQADLALLGAVTGSLRAETVVAAGQPVGRLRVPWTSRPVPAVTATAARLVRWPGDRTRRRLEAVRLGPSVRPGQVVGHLVVSDGTEQTVVAVRAAGGLVGPDWRWRLLHG